MKKIDGLLIGAMGCVIGLAILAELIELNYRIARERTVIVPIEPMWAPVAPTEPDREEGEILENDPSVLSPPSPDKIN